MAYCAIAGSSSGYIAAALAQTGSPVYGILGETAPDIEANFWIDGNGEPTTFSMTQAKNRWLFVKCFQSWCPGCHEHGLPTLKKVVDAFKGDDRVVPIAIQTVFEGFGTNTGDKVRETQLQYDLPITMGHDPGDPNGDNRPTTMRRYRTGGTPWMILVNPAGQVIYNHFQVDGDKLIAYIRSELA